MSIHTELFIAGLSAGIALTTILIASVHVLLHWQETKDFMNAKDAYTSQAIHRQINSEN